MDIEKDELPQGWAWARFDEVARRVETVDARRLNSAFPYVDVQSIDNERAIVDDAKEIVPKDAPSRAKHAVLPGDLIISTVRTYLRNTALIPEHLQHAIASTAFCALRPCEGVNSRYLYYRARQDQFVKDLTACQRGNSPPACTDDDVRAQLVPVAPSSEQTRIADKIDELFSDIDEGERGLRKVQALLKKHRQAVLKAAVNGELTREWRQKQPSDMVERCAEISAPFNLPSGWRWLAVREAGEVQLGRQRAPQHHFGPHMRPYLRVANVMDSYIDTSDILEMNFDEREYERYRLEPGDILLNEGQSPDLIGRSAIYNGEVPGACFQKTLLRFRAGAKVQPKFAQMVFRHYMWSGYFRKNSRITTSIGHLTAERFSKLYFPLPVDGEQCQIIDRVEEEMSKIDAMEAVVAAELKRSARLRQSILKAAFTGKLVPQHPTDEPAAALLARLQAKSVQLNGRGEPVELHEQARRRGRRSKVSLSASPVGDR